MQQRQQTFLWVCSYLPRTLTAKTYPYTQRFFDIIAGLIGVLVLAMFIPICWLANLIWAPGPLFYRQTRIGLRGRHFTMIKFRSMVVTAEQNGAVWTAKADPRITSVGCWLRRTHLDELPQCWNILRGEMSLIGPRPERPEFAALLAQAIKGYNRRHQVKPGLTGWAQVCYGYGDSVEDARIKLNYDLEYIAHQSWLFDLIILLRTMGVFWKGR